MSAPGSPDGSAAADRLMAMFDAKQPQVTRQGSDHQLDDSVDTAVLKKAESDGSLPAESAEEKFASFFLFSSVFSDVQVPSTPSLFCSIVFRKFFVKVECIEIVEGEKIKEVKIFEVFPSTTVDEFQKKACKRFCKWEDWRYGLYSIQNSAWMTSGSMADYNLKPMVFPFFFFLWIVMFLILIFSFHFISFSFILVLFSFPFFFFFISNSFPFCDDDCRASSNSRQKVPTTLTPSQNQRSTPRKPQSTSTYFLEP